MEHLNKVTLRGVVGTTRILSVQGRKICKFTLATNFTYKAYDGSAVIETTWHNITAWESEDNQIDTFNKGSRVTVEGRLRNCRYTDSSGNEHSTTEIIATSVCPVTTEEL